MKPAFDRKFRGAGIVITDRMKRLYRLVMSVLLFGSLLAPPSIASAASAERTYKIHTRMVERSPGVGEFDGSLQLQISPDGIISGFYRPDDNAQFIAVTGGLNGDRVWLDIGSFSTHPWRFSGSFSNGKIDAGSDRPLLDDGHITGLDLIGIPQAG